MAILTFKVKGQTLTVESKINKIVENSVNYLDYEIIYDDEKWDPPLAKKVVVTYDKKTYEIFGDKIPSQVIHTPGFTVSVIGYKSDSEDDSGIIITTYPVAIKVFPSGVIKGTIPEDTAIDSSVAEQLNEKIEIQANEIKNNYLSKDLLRILINENSTNLEVPTAKAVYDCVEALKTEIVGELDEIGDLVGGETGDTTDFIFEETATFTNNGNGSRIATLGTLDPNTIETPYNYTLSIADNEYEVMAVHLEGNLVIVDTDDSMSLMTTEDGAMIGYISEDVEERVETVRIKKSSQPFYPYTFAVSNSSDTTNAMLYSYEFVEGDATLLVVDETGTQLVNENLTFSVQDLTDEKLYGFRSVYSTDHYFSVVNLFEALSQGKVCTITVTQTVNGNEKVTTFGGANDMPKFQKAEGHNNYWFNHYDCYYWGNTFIPFSD